MADEEGDLHDGLMVSSDYDLGYVKNDGVSCELGIRYPTLQSIVSGSKNILTIKVLRSVRCDVIICNNDIVIMSNNDVI